MTQTIITLWQQGNSHRKIAKLVNKSRDTVRHAIDRYKRTGSIEAIKIQKKTKLEDSTAYIIELLEKNLSAVRIHEELRSRGVDVGYTTIKDYVRNVKVEKKVCVRFHTKPGEESQVDFGYVGLHYDNQNCKRKTWVFNMRLSFSRVDYYETVFDQKVITFIKAHINAFRFFGGVPLVVKIDNLKAAILEANFYQENYQREYKAFADHYSFNILPCRVASPQEKGKVEAGIKFVKRNFFAGRSFISKDEMDNQLKIWIERQNRRVHGTTKKKPTEVFEQEERGLLLPLPVQDFILPEVVRRKVGHDCHITVDNNYYSVPYEYIGKKVDVHCDNKLIQIYFENKSIALHSKCESRGEFITNLSHYPKYKNFTPESEEYRSAYKQKMHSVGEYAEQVFSFLLVSKPYHWYRIVSGILSLRKVYSDEVINLSCKRALEFNALKYSVIKNICKAGSYNMPSEFGETICKH